MVAKKGRSPKQQQQRSHRSLKSRSSKATTSSTARSAKSAVPQKRRQRRPRSEPQQQAAAPKQTSRQRPLPTRQRPTGKGSRNLVAVCIAAGLFGLGGYLWSIRNPQESVSISDSLSVENSMFDQLLDFTSEVDSNAPVEAGDPVAQPDFRSQAFATPSESTSANYGSANPFESEGSQTTTTRTVSAPVVTQPAANLTPQTGAGFGADPAFAGGPSFGENNGATAGGSTGPSLGGPMLNAPPQPPLESPNSNPFAEQPQMAPSGPVFGTPSAQTGQPGTTQLTSGTSVTPATSGSGPVIVPGAYHN